MRLSALLAALALLWSLSPPLLASADGPGETRGAPSPPSRKAVDMPFQSCINLGGALEAPREGEWGYRIRREDLARISAAGFEAIRLPVAWSNHTTRRAPHTIDESVFRRVDEIIEAALAEDLKVILDVHHFYQLMTDPDRHQDHLDDIWRQISERYKGWPDGLIFEFLNEPHSGMTAELVDNMNERLLSIVRPDHPDRWIIVSGADWGGLNGLDAAEFPTDKRLIASFHFYDPFGFTHQNAHFAGYIHNQEERWGSKDHFDSLGVEMDRAAAFRRRTGLPIFLGEFGVYEKASLEERVRWTRAVREAAEAEHFGWCYFDWATSFQIYDLSNERWIMSLRHALLD